MNLKANGSADVSVLDGLLDKAGRWLARVLEKEAVGYKPFTPSDPVTLRRTLQPGDVVLVEGNQKISAAIKYLTQSTWSHAGIYIGDALGTPEDGSEPLTLIEVNIATGAIAVPLSKYAPFNTRICRPVRLTVQDRAQVVQYMIDRLGTQYDTKNIIDLMRYLIPTPPVPIRWRRRMLAFGSGDPTRAICTSLIALAFQSIRYPILPHVEQIDGIPYAVSGYSRSEILHIRHHTLFTPRDFDVSPYFDIVKPTLEGGFNYKSLTWGDGEPAAPETLEIRRN